MTYRGLSDALRCGAAMRRWRLNRLRAKTVGESDGSCDIAGGARAWDYDRYNPWGIVGNAQRHFDPLWGMIDPAAGTWFPAQALDLALRAEPPLLP